MLTKLERIWYNMGKICYKLFRVNKKGKLFPLYVLSEKETPIGTWINAECGHMVNGKVKSKLGLLKYRGGWHCSEIPLATHIGIRGSDGSIQYMNPNHVWAEVEVDDRFNIQEEVNKNGMKNGKFVPRDACVEMVEPGQYYHYKTTAQMFKDWIIAGKIKVNRILSDDEVAMICRENGVEPMPRLNVSEKYKEERLG